MARRPRDNPAQVDLFENRPPPAQAPRGAVPAGPPPLPPILAIGVPGGASACPGVIPRHGSSMSHGASLRPEPPPGRSDATGGPLSALEAERLMTGRSIAYVGFESAGGACCRRCLDSLGAVRARAEAGPFLRYLWQAARHDGTGRPVAVRRSECSVCGDAFEHEE